MRGIATGGSRGPAGAGVPVGGTSGQVLAKNSNTDYDTGWVDAAASGAVTVTKKTFQQRTVLYDNTLSVAGNWDVQNISQDYDHLEIVFEGIPESGTGGTAYVYFNGDTTATNYVTRRHYSGLTHGTDGGNNSLVLLYISNYDANAFAQAVGTILNYRNNHFKGISSLAHKYVGSTAYDEVAQYSGYWLNTAAIDRIQISASVGSFKAGARLQIIGIKEEEVVTDVQNAGPVSESPVIPDTVQGRLTLTSGTAVTTSDVTAASTLYFTPYRGNKIHLYSNGGWVLHSFTETSIDLSALVANTNFDIFAYSSSGTLALELLAWSADTTRATELTQQDGVYVKTGDATRRYLGTLRTTGTAGQCEDSQYKRYLWNYYNTHRKRLYKNSFTSHTYNGTSARYWNNDSSQKVEFVIGIVEDLVYAHLYGNTSDVSAFVYPNLNNTTNKYTEPFVYTKMHGSSPIQNYPVNGYNYIAVCEHSDTGGNFTFTQFRFHATIQA